MWLAIWFMNTHIEHLDGLLLYFKAFRFVGIARNNFVKYDKTLCGKQCLDFESALCFTYQWEHVICIWQQYSDWNLFFIQKSNKLGALHLGHNENVLFHLNYGRWLQSTQSPPPI